MHVRQAYFDRPDPLSDWPTPLFGFDGRKPAAPEIRR